ncbi:hypothetical protein RGCCGE502_09340 [Rhizobium grahamii CCGE 502]|uniref:Uncharacterized protein n=1 Tax=Rhizobium grahamii CCGE 502 TaxID=990285 RepID=S3HIP1_9HYPH|nr:hypothetical protein RGCCGE502_09340 [Rhizobium grahamii CCGE 502]
MDLPSGTIRFWDGSGGPFVDADGEIYRSCVLTEDALAQIEAAINAEAFTLSLVLSGIDVDTSNKVWEDYQAGNIVGSPFRILLQKCDDREQPVGNPITKFTGTVSNLNFVDQASDTGINSTIQVDVANRFTLRSVTNGSVLSDVDQRARAKVLNPALADDRFCERIPGLKDRTIRWPNW